MKNFIQPKLKVWSELEITARLVIIDVISDYWWMFDGELDEITTEDMTEMEEITMEQMTGLDEVSGRAKIEDDQEDHQCQVVRRKGTSGKSQKITDWFSRPKLDLGVEKCSLGDVPHPKSGMGMVTIGGENVDSEYDHWNAIDLVEDFLVDLVDDWWLTLVRKKKAAKKETEWSIRNLINRKVLDNVMTEIWRRDNAIELRKEKIPQEHDLELTEVPLILKKCETNYRGEGRTFGPNILELKRGLEEGGSEIQTGGGLVFNNPEQEEKVAAFRAVGS